MGEALDTGQLNVYGDDMTEITLSLQDARILANVIGSITVASGDLIMGEMGEAASIFAPYMRLTDKIEEVDPLFDGKHLKFLQDMNRSHGALRFVK